MTAASTFSLCVRLERAALDLRDARIADLETVTRHAEAKGDLDVSVAQRIAAGLNEKIQAERNACLRFELTDHHARLHEAEDELAECRCRLDGESRLRYAILVATVMVSP